MEKNNPNNQVCGCGCGFKTNNQSLLRLMEVVEQEERRVKAEETQRVMVAASRWALKE